MRHGKVYRKFNRTAEHRRAMFANMCAALIKHEQITTTLPKAKDLRPVVEKLITLGKRGGVPARRQALAALQDTKGTDKLSTPPAQRDAKRPAGINPIVKAAFPSGANARSARCGAGRRGRAGAGGGDGLGIAEETGQGGKPNHRPHRIALIEQAVAAIGRSIARRCLGEPTRYRAIGLGLVPADQRVTGQISRLDRSAMCREIL